jgi:hypothetical protein
VNDLAIVLAVLTPIGPMAVVALRWLSRRIRWITQVNVAARLRDHPAGTGLLIRRALANQLLRKLVTLDSDPAAARRRRHPAVVHALAGLELLRLRLRPVTATYAIARTPL